MFNTLEVQERRHIYRVVRACKNNISKAAQVLGIDRRTLYRKLDKYYKQRRALVATVTPVYPSATITYDYVSAYPASLSGGAGSTAIKLLAQSYANELKET